MSFDLKPLTSEIIHKMNYEPHSLWIVKLNDEVFGPFEVESLKHYAMENEPQFQHALASRIDTNDWQPFFSHANFLSILEHENPNKPVFEKYWIMNFGQKVGPLSRQDIDKKIELGILSMTDLVSVDDGNTWLKFFSHGFFTPQASEIGEPPLAPLESSFQKARDELFETMNNQEKTNTHIALAALTYLAQSKGKVHLNLEEMDLKSLNDTEISRSLKWAIPSALAVVVVLAIMGTFVFSPSSDLASDEKTEISNGKSNRKNNQRERTPASYRPLNQNRSALTAAPSISENEYPSSVETHFNDQDPPIDQPIDQPIEAENNPPQESQEPQEPQEHSLVSNNQPENNGESLDQVMGADAPAEVQPQDQTVEAASDF